VKRFLVRSAGVAAVWAACALPADAQVIRTRPFPGIFGSGDPAKSVTQVDFLSFIAGGAEKTSFSFNDNRPGSDVDDHYGFGSVVFRGRVAHQGRRNNFIGDARTTTAYYAGRTGMSPFNFSGSVRFNGAWARHGTFALRQSMFYSPYYVVTGVTATEPDDAAAAPEPEVVDTTVDPRIDYRATRLSTKGYNTAASVGHQVGEGGFLFASYWLNYIDYAPGVYDLLSQAPRAGYRQRLGRWTSFTAAYGMQLYEYRNSPFKRLTSHDVNLGVRYDRPLSAFRRTTIGFGASTAFIGEGTLTRTYINGNAHLAHRFGRTWLTRIAYYRGQQVLEGFEEPFFTFADVASVTVGGKVGRDVGLSGRAYYSHNRYTIDTFRNDFDIVSGSARVTVPVMWALDAYAEGFYSRHDFQRRLGLLVGVPTSLDRIGLRAGLTVSVPVLR
jgi:hypothetical protein